MNPQVLSLVIFLFAAINVKAQNFIWSNKIQASHQGKRSIACDDSGNVYVAGTSSVVSFDSVRFSGPLFFAKYNSEGNLVWGKGINGGKVYTIKVFLDSKGSIYMSGNFTGTVFFGQHQVATAYGEYANFLVQCDYNGNYLWARKIFSGGFNASPFISTDTSGSIYMLGVNFESDLPVSGEGRFVISKLNASGEFQWLKKTGVSDGPVYLRDFAVDAVGNIYITGSFGRYHGPYSGILSFGTNILESDGEINIFLARFDMNGNAVWAKKAGGERAPYVNYYNNQGQFIALDNSGNVYMSGTFGDSAVFEGIKIKRNQGDYVGMFYCKYDTSGNLKWVKSGAKGDIACDNQGNVFVVSENDLLIKCNPDGERIWSISAPKEAIDYLDGPQNVLATDLKGNCYMIGAFMKKITLGHSTFVSPVSGDGLYLSCINDGTYISRHGNTITGKVFTDRNGNCTFDSGENVLSNIAVTATPGGYYSITDEKGNYVLKVDSGTYHVSLVHQKSDVALWKENCFQTSYEVTFTGEHQSVTGLDLELEKENCPLLEIILSDSYADFLGTSYNSCDYPDSTYIFYYNYGDIPVHNVQLTLEYPRGISPIASTIPWENISDKVIAFNFPTLGAKESGYIGIKDLIEPCEELWNFYYSGSITPFLSCKSKDTIFYKSNLNKWKFIPLSSPKSIDVNPFKVLAYPNPFAEEVTFSINGLNKIENVVLSLIDTHGNIKYKEDVEISSMNVNVILKNLKLDQGIYFYKIESKGSLIGKGKLIKIE